MGTDRNLDVLAAISLGGVLGALARHGMAVALPHGPLGFPWATFLTNVSGCLLIGLLMVFVTEAWPPNRYLRPFLGVGVLGGFTTFSTYTVEVRSLIEAGAVPLALAYLAGSVLAGLAAVQVGVVLARLSMQSRRLAPDRGLAREEPS